MFFDGFRAAPGWMTLVTVMPVLGATESMALSDRVATWRNRQLISLISGVPGLEHLERPEYLTEVERLNTNRRQLATAPRPVLNNVTSLARIVTLLVLLASVTPCCCCRRSRPAPRCWPTGSPNA